MLFMILLAGFFSAFGFVFGSTLAGAAEDSSRDFYKSKPLDGVVIEAVEDYLTPKSSELDLGLGFFPFDSYYLGLSLNIGYTWNISPTISWECINASYVFDYQKALTTELADKYQVQPTTLNSLNWIISSNVMYVFSYGKFVLLKDYIRYFRSSLIFGLGIVNKAQTGGFAGNLGLKLEVFTSETFAWKLEVRNSTVISGFDNNTSFILGPSIQF